MKSSPRRMQLGKRGASVWPVLALLVAIVTGFSLLWGMPARAAIGIRAATSAENGAGTSSLTISTPAGTAIGDVLVAGLSMRFASPCVAQNIVAPSGWSQAAISSIRNTGGVGLQIFYLAVTAAPAASYTFTLQCEDNTASIVSATQKTAGGIIAYTGVDIAQPIDVSAIQNNTTASTTDTAPSVTTTVPNTMLVAMYGHATSATVSAAGAGMTTRYQVTSSGGGSASTKAMSSAQDAILAAAGASGARTQTVSASAASVGGTIALRPAPVISQAQYRFFQNSDTTAASTPYVASGTSASIGSATPFRLRLNLGVASGGSNMTAVATRAFTLQYALRGSDNTCDASFTGETYANVTTSSTVQFYNNPTPADGSAYVANANDPTRSGVTAVGQKYSESNPLVAGTNVPAGQDALWDVSLTTNGVTPGQSYCLRVVGANTANPLAGGYSSMPEFSIASSTLSQANYRWFTNANSATPGAPLAAQDSAASIAPATPIRLRQRIAVDAVPLGQSGANLKLQYAEKSGTCDVAFSGEAYADIITSTANTPSKLGSSAVDTANNGTPWSAGVTTLNATDSTYTGTSSGTSPSYTNDAILTGYGFSVPANVTITGIGISVPYQASKNGLSSPQLNLTPVLNSTNIGTLKTVVYGATGNGVTVAGGATDTLGISSLTPSVVNDPTFGFRVSVLADTDPTGSDVTSLYLDSVAVTIYYTASNPIRYYDNSTPADGATISSLAGDPTNGSRPTVYQTYSEASPFSNSVASIPVGSDGLWDFSLTSEQSALGKTYCFRAVKSDGSLLNSYFQIPELSIASASAGPTLDQQLRGGQSYVSGTKRGYTW